MYYQKFIDFLKKHNLYDEDVINYWKNHKVSFDYREEEQRDFIGCFYMLRDNVLEKISLIVPFIDNDKTVLINIHEYVHLFLLYPKLRKKCIIGIDKEVLPILYEKIYIHENPTDELINYYEYLNSFIEKSGKEEYLIALDISEQLLENNYSNIRQLERKTKKLTKFYQKRCQKK